MLHRELQWFANDCPPVDGHTPNFCMLVVLEQPGCEVPFKGKPLTGHYKVCVVTGAGVAASVGAVGRAVLVGADVVPSNKPGKAGKPDVEHAEAVMDPLSKTAVFQHVVPAISTRMSPAHLVFECDVHVGDEYGFGCPFWPLLTLLLSGAIRTFCALGPRTPLSSSRTRGNGVTPRASWCYTTPLVAICHAPSASRVFSTQYICIICAFRARTFARRSVSSPRWIFSTFTTVSLLPAPR